MEKIITYFGQPMKVKCDEKCNKAWGVSQRPSESLSDDEDNIVFLSDDELGLAPIDPRTYEGGEGKPVFPYEKPNKWCVRECERCAKSELGKYNDPLEIDDFSKRIYNKPQNNETSKNNQRQPRN